VKKLTLYLDTSVFGGYFDEEFKEFTVPLFERIKDEDFEVIFSDITENELLNAPNRVKTLVESLPIQSTKYVNSNEESIQLAQ